MNREVNGPAGFINWDFLRRMDWLMFTCILLLAGIGVAFIYSSCYLSPDIPVRTLYKKQMFWVLAGLAGYVAITLTDYRQLQEVSWVMYAGILVLLLLVLVIGNEISGARRWLDFFGINVQPSELAKIVTLVCVATLLSQPEHVVRDPRTMVLVAVLVGVPMLLIRMQPDLGTCLIFVPMILSIMFVAGVSGRLLRMLILTGLVVILFVVAALTVPQKLGWSQQTQDRVARLTLLKEYQQDRIRSAIDPELDPHDKGYNTIQSKIAVGSGGLTGKGFCKGASNFLGYLPRSVAPTDFIYSVIAEEMGFVGSAVVLALFATVILCGLRTGLRSEDRMGQLLCVGIAIMLAAHVLVNIAMTVGILPVTGLPLPLVSYGGTFMISTMAALGLIQSVHVRNRRAKEPELEF